LERPVFSASVAIVSDFVIEATLPILHIKPIRAYFRCIVHVRGALCL
jgi:hypothetical protein